MTSRPSSSFRLLVTLSTLSGLCLPAAALPGLWEIVLEEGPAPPRESGPPISANAVRDPKYLPYEVIAICGSYLVAVAVVGIAILLIGRRRRRAFQQPAQKGGSMEKAQRLTGDKRPNFKLSPMDQSQSGKLFGPSPVSPSKFWASPNLSIKHGWDTVTRKSSKRSVAPSFLTVDGTAEDVCTRNEIEMDRLYAAVAEHETAKELGIDIVEFKAYEQHPPEFQHLRHGVPGMTEEPVQEIIGASFSRTSTTSPRADTTSPQRTHSNRFNNKKPIPSPISINYSARSSRSSLGSAHARSLRHCNISQPMGSPDLVPDRHDIYGEAEPLTPRNYQPGPPPLPPLSSYPIPSRQTSSKQPSYPSSSPYAQTTFSSQAQADNPTSSHPVAQMATYRRDENSARDRQVLASPSPYDPSTGTPRATHFSSSIRSSRASSLGIVSAIHNSPASPLQSARTPDFPRTIAEEQDKIHHGATQSPISPRRHAHQASYASGESDIKPGFEFALDPAPRATGESARANGAGDSSPTKRARSIAESSKSAEERASGSGHNTPKLKKAAPLLTISTGATPSGGSNHASAQTRTPPQSASANGSTATLPLRAAQLPLRGMALASPSSGQRPLSTIKATVLDRPAKNGGRLGTGGLPPTTPGGTQTARGAGPRAGAGVFGPAGLRVPGTAGCMPQTPYSPFYMPQTPLTPMTPSRLVGREERKRREKEERRRRVGEQDVVVEEGEMWGDGY